MHLDDGSKQVFLFKRFELHNKILLRMIKWMERGRNSTTELFRIPGNNLIIIDTLSTRV